MPRRKADPAPPAPGDQVADYRHADKPKHIPPAGLAAQGRVQTIYMDPPYGIKFASNQSQAAGTMKYYARNDGLGFVIPYEYLGVSNHYEPDFLAKLANDVTLVLEIKGMVTDQDNAKHEAARRWIAAVNNWGQLGRWAFHVNKDPQMLGVELRHIVGTGL